MIIDIKKVFEVIITVGIVLFPVSAIEISQLAFLRGLASEASFYPLAVGLIIWIIRGAFKKNNFLFPRQYSAYFLICFFISVLISGGVNLYYIVYSEYRNIDGLVRFVSLSMGVLFCSVVAVFTYNCSLCIGRKIIYIFQRSLFISFFLVCGYSVFEIFGYLGWSEAREITNILDMIFRNSSSAAPNNFRLHSIALEPSFLAMYLGFVYPWVFFEIFDNNTKKWKAILANLFALLIMVLTWSRSMYLLFLVEIFLLIYASRKILKKYIKEITLMFGLVIIVAIVMISNMDVDFNIFSIYMSVLVINQSDSNLARYGTQVAGLNLFIENPLFGIGLGQYAFYIREAMPSWAYESIEISRDITPYIGVSWPIIHGLYARLLGETGGVGFISWIGVWCCLIISLSKMIKKENVIEIKKKLICYRVSLVMLLLFGFNHDSFTMYYYWVTLGVGWGLLDVYRKENYK